MSLSLSSSRFFLSFFSLFPLFYPVHSRALSLSIFYPSPSLSLLLYVSVSLSPSGSPRLSLFISLSLSLCLPLSLSLSLSFSWFFFRSLCVHFSLFPFLSLSRSGTACPSLFLFVRVSVSLFSPGGFMHVLTSSLLPVVLCFWHIVPPAALRFFPSFLCGCVFSTVLMSRCRFEKVFVRRR